MLESSRAAQVHASILNTVDVHVFNDRISSQLPVAKKRPGPKRTPISSNSQSNTGRKFRPPVSVAKKSYTVRYKLQVLAYLNQASISDGPQSVNRVRKPTLAETSLRFKIPVANISRWKQAESKLLTRVGTERRSRIGKRKWPVLERELYDAFQAQRKQGKIVRRGYFRVKAKLLFQQYHPNQGVFRFSNGWFNGFLNWYNISLRFGTNTASKIPMDLFNTLVNFARFNRRNSQVRDGDTPATIGRYRLRNICNMDQTPLPFEFLSGQTYENKGANTVWIKGTTSGWDKRQATLQLTVFADGGNYVKPLVFYHGKGLGAAVLREMKEYDPRVVVKFNPTAYANSGNMVEWLQEQLIPILGNYPTLLAVDLFSGHKTEEVLNTMKANDITVSVIPAGCTSIVQPLDISINRPFKELLREKIDEGEESMREKEEALVGTGRKLAGSKVGRRRIMTTWAIGEAWEEFCTKRREVIIRSFTAVGLSLPIDGSHDCSQLSLKGVDMERFMEDIQNWQMGGVGNTGDEDDNSEEIISETEDNSEAINYVVGPLRTEE